MLTKHKRFQSWLHSLLLLLLHLNSSHSLTPSLLSRIFTVLVCCYSVEIPENLDIETLSNRILYHKLINEIKINTGITILLPLENCNSTVSHPYQICMLPYVSPFVTLLPYLQPETINYKYYMLVSRAGKT